MAIIEVLYSSSSEPSAFDVKHTPLQYSKSPSVPPPRISFSREELNSILRLYGMMVAAGEWRDYAIDLLSEMAIFSVFRRSSECPLYRIEKNPKLARKQGAYSIITQSGLILKRGHELETVLKVFDRKLKVVE